MSSREPVTAEACLPMVALQVSLAGAKPQLIFADHDGFTIGSGSQCDLTLRDLGLPRLHSVLHLQGQAVWIEAADDDALINIDGEIYRRRALRDGDQLRFGTARVFVHIGEKSVDAAQTVPRPHFRAGNLARLSAEELCELIELEESQIHDFERGRRRGLQALLSAVQETRQPRTATAAPLITTITDEKFEEMVAHVQGLSDSLEERTKELAAQEAILMESSSQLAEAQLRVSRRLEQLLEHLAAEESGQRDDLRVSA